MIKGRDFVVFSDTLGDLPTSAFHLFKYIARENRVFWFNTLCRMPRWSRLDFRKAGKALASWLPFAGRRAPQDAGDRSAIRAVSPMMVPVFTPFFRRVNQSLLLRSYRRLESRQGIQDPIFLTTFPVAADFFQSFPNDLKLYYCVDDFLNYPGIDHDRWRTLEGDLLRCVDGMVVTSKHLSRKCPDGLSLLHLPHGVDFAHFHSPAGAAPVPELAGLPRPIVGFFGLVSDWVDLGLIAHLADSFPNATFVLIGRSEVSLERIAGKKNIKILSHVPYAELPRFASCFDLGLIPFVINELTRAVNPLKLLEYYALGLPVLATRLPELEGFPGPIRLAETAEEFRAALGDMLQHCSPEVSLQAVQVARENSWRARVRTLLQFIERLEEPCRTLAAA